MRIRQTAAVAATTARVARTSTETLLIARRNRRNRQARTFVTTNTGTHIRVIRTAVTARVMPMPSYTQMNARAPMDTSALMKMGIARHVPNVAVSLTTHHLKPAATGSSMILNSEAVVLMSPRHSLPVSDPKSTIPRSKVELSAHDPDAEVSNMISKTKAVAATHCIAVRVKSAAREQ